ncbi:MAG: isoprenylcysteine carboxylmethyltransferase family protein [Pseudomonadota bacterium]
MGRKLDLLIPPPVVGLVCGLAMWGIASAMPALCFAFPLQTTLAAVLIVAGLALDMAAIGAFWKAKTTVTPLAPEKASSLVVEGLYRFTRNPMYLGLLLILSGLAILLGSPVSMIVLAVFVAYITAFQIKPEEARLQEVFGADYLAYMKRVRRWL